MIEIFRRTHHYEDADSAETGREAANVTDDVSGYQEAAAQKERSEKIDAELRAVMEAYGLRDNWTEAFNTVEPITAAVSARLGFKVEEHEIRSRITQALEAA